MKSKVFAAVTAIILTAGAVIAFSLTSAEKLAAHDRKGEFHAVKECSQNQGLPGNFCTFVSSSLSLIPPGSKIYYDQAMGIPAGMLDSNVILDAGLGNRAIGRCTLDLATGSGLCNFTDGTGKFAGFEARIAVSYAGGPNFRWQGTYDVDRR
jgi:hypothetical protein